MSRPLARARAWLAAALLVTLAACTSPTLPLPPPTAPTIGVGIEPNTYVLRSDEGALPNALIIVVNRNESLAPHERVSGTIADEVGSWELAISGYAGDVVDISQEDGTTRSPATTVTLK